MKITRSRSHSRVQSLLELNFTLSRMNFVYDYFSSMKCNSREELTAFTLKRGKFNSNKNWSLESLLESVIFTPLHLACLECRSSPMSKRGSMGRSFRKLHGFTAYSCKILCIFFFWYFNTFFLQISLKGKSGGGGIITRAILQCQKVEEMYPPFPRSPPLL